MYKKYLLPGSLLLGTALISACSPVVTRPAYVDSSYEPSILSYASKEGPVYTEVIGSPFAGEAGQVDRVITEALKEAQFSGRQLDFTTQRPQDYRSPYRVVLLFNPAPNANAAKICANPEQPQNEGTPGEVMVMVAFCNGDTRVSSTAGYASPATTADAPAFGQLIRQVAMDIFPPRSFQRRSDPADFDS
jgi:hypothetical protein